MDIIERIFTDHLSYLFASPQLKGKLDPITMAMHLPLQWREEPLGLFVRAHELIHFRLTYSTGLGIFLDMIGGISSVKIFNLLKHTTKGEVLFPLTRNLEDSANVTKEVRGQVAFSIACELGLDVGINIWRFLQEGVATYAMLELAPQKILEEGIFTQSEIERARTEILNNIYGIYREGYLECLRASKVLGKNQVYPAAMIASEVPFYTINLFTTDNNGPLGITGEMFVKEIERFCEYLSSQAPLIRFRKLVHSINEKRVDISEARDLKVFDTFIIPDLFPSTDWQDKVDKWILKLINTFGDFSPDLASRVFNFYHEIVDKGWTPTLLYEDDKGEFRMGLLRGLEETAILRYILGSLKMVCLGHSGETTVYLPSNWDKLSIKGWIQDFQEIVKKHRLSIRFGTLDTV